MVDSRLVDELTEAIVARLGPEKLWEMALSCQAVCVREDADKLHLILACGAERLGMQGPGNGVDSELGRYIDHTLLRADATRDEIEQLSREGRDFGFASVCVNPVWVRVAHGILKESQTRVCSVVGFPLGASTSDAKAYEARRAIFDGAGEIDMVINVGALKGNQDRLVENDIRVVVEPCQESGALCKVIIETAFLTDDEKVRACLLAKEAGAEFVKTSTGFGPGGATTQDVALMRRTVGAQMGVKAAGGIKDAEQTRDLIAAGATRIGASAGIKIIQGASAESASAY